MKRHWRHPLNLLRFWFTNRAIRVGIFGCVVLTGLIATLSSLAIAKGDQALAELAEQVMRLPDAHYSNAPLPIQINGVQLAFQTGYAYRDFEAVSAQFAAECRSKSGFVGNDRGQKQLKQWTRGESLFSGVHRKDTPRGTILACVDTRGVSWFGQQMLDQLHTFSEAFDLNAIGTFRYALVKRTSYGAHFVTLWTQGAAPLMKMFPVEGDAPGVDYRGLPRVAGGRRLLSVSSLALQAVAFEHPTENIAEVVHGYETAIAQSGYSFQRFGRAEAQLAGILRREDGQAFILVQKSAQGAIAQIADFPQ